MKSNEKEMYVFSSMVKIYGPIHEREFVDLLLKLYKIKPWSPMHQPRKYGLIVCYISTLCEWNNQSNIFINLASLIACGMEMLTYNNIIFTCCLVCKYTIICLFALSIFLQNFYLRLLRNPNKISSRVHKRWN